MSKSGECYRPSTASPHLQDQTQRHILAYDPRKQASWSPSKTAQNIPSKVIIVGGGIGGLSLANMLQKHDIDFVVLEAYPDIAPQVGASIGFLPHGLRILDQLGIYKDILKLVKPLDFFRFHDYRGKLLAKHGGVEHSFTQRREL
ncbi:hypothetical protein AJ79_05177 [Helicocarpus griseus UAMH5409]|uniref:FAD-binding domain-containing protein n=1 Tax=Helicocarpus griseus UAMH5409 TaxID=1447875 RepID=A0A2B7XQ81_9EURO|nr:hypothetical protein AJ79_05177 [Helicocarpus griseus UAMH5409]